MYLIPYTRGPTGKLEVFLLPTKYGSVIFCFPTPDIALPPYLELCEIILADGYQLETQINLARDQERLQASIAAEIAIGEPFILAIEGTSMFSRLLNELADGTIWPS